MLKLDEKTLDEIIKIRHELHMYPEISEKEYRTTKLIKNYLKKLQFIEIIDFPIETGVVARLKGIESKKTIALRSDIDAIFQLEEKNLSYASKNKGIMHACGHDFHMASLLGAVNILLNNRKKLDKDVIFVFQSAEETTKGAKKLIEKGLFEKLNINMFFGFHNDPMTESGKVVLKRGALMAAKTNFLIEIIGKGGHGSNPHLNIDPIVCASNIVMALQTIISRNVDPISKNLLSINSINGGSSDNLVVDSVKMTATIRSLDIDNFGVAKKRLNEIIDKISQAYGCKYKIETTDDIPMVYNKREMYELAKKITEKVVGKDKIVTTNPTMASEDFAFYMQKVPSFMYWFGSAEEGVNRYPLHSRKFYASDEGIKTASEILANSVIEV